MDKSHRVIFLDRDGTINVDYGYLYKPEQFELLPDAIEGLKLFQKMGFDLMIITNQSGIGRGMFTTEEYYEFQAFFENELKKQDITILSTYFCPHTDADNCNCRKPRSGLYERAIEEWNIDVSKSYAIGDRIRDVAICSSIPEIKGFVIGKKPMKNVEGITFVNSLLEAARLVEAGVV